MTIDEFGQTIKEKYPQYKDIPNDKLGQTMVDKYPQYKDLISYKGGINKLTGQPNTPTKMPEEVGGFLAGHPILKMVSDAIGTTGLAKGAAQGILFNFTPEGKALLKQVADGHIKWADAEKILGPIATNKEVIGSAVQTGASALTGGLSSVKGATTLGTIGKSAATFGGISAVNSGAQAYGEGKTVPQIAGEAAKGAAVGAVLGGVGASIVPAVKAAKNLPLDMVKKNPVKASKAVEGAAKQIVQGKIADIAPAKKALAEINVDGVKTYKDLGNRIDKHITELSSTLDKSLATKGGTVPLEKLSVTHKVGDQVVSHNYVKDALSQLKNYYKKANDVVNEKTVSLLEKKASTKGLSVKEINDLARMHGRDLNAYNANGELASGLSKQAAENTRAGLKGTARKLFGNDSYKNIDEQLSNLIRTRDLVRKVEEKVSSLQGKIQQRNLGQKVGYGIAKGADILSGGALKGIIQGLIPRGQGFKTLNAIDLEKVLVKNLSKLQKLSK